MKKGYIYILQDEGKKLYIGSTANLKRRLRQHKDKRDVRATTYRMKNPRAVFVQEFASIEIARKIEKKLKRLKRKDYIEKIIADGYIKMKI